MQMKNKIGPVLTSAVLVLMLNSPAHSMSQAPRFQTLFEPAAVRALLESPDSREQAWGAWLAGQSQMREAIPLLQQIIDKRVTGTDPYSDGLPLYAALDALIQMEGKLPTAIIPAVYQKRPAQALVLLSHLGSDGDPFMLDLAAREHGIKWFAAANLLVAHRAPGTAFLLLRAVEIKASIYVSKDGLVSGGGGSGGGGSGDSGTGSAPGYPPMAYYYLTDAAYSGSIVLTPGPKTVYYRRILTAPGEFPGWAGTFHSWASSCRFFELHRSIGRFPIFNASESRGIPIHCMAWTGCIRSGNQDIQGGYFPALFTTIADAH